MHQAVPAWCRRSCRSRSGFTLVEVVVAAAAADCRGGWHRTADRIAVRANRSRAGQTMTALVAAQKMEQLRSLSWTFDSSGGVRSDMSTDVSRDPAVSGGIGLGTTPAGSLDRSVDGCVDYLDSRRPLDWNRDDSSRRLRLRQTLGGASAERRSCAHARARRAGGRARGRARAGSAHPGAAPAPAAGHACSWRSKRVRRRRHDAGGAFVVVRGRVHVHRVARGLGDVRGDGGRDDRARAGSADGVHGDWRRGRRSAEDAGGSRCDSARSVRRGRGQRAASGRRLACAVSAVHPAVRGHCRRLRHLVTHRTA